MSNKAIKRTSLTLRLLLITMKMKRKKRLS